MCLLTCQIPPPAGVWIFLRLPSPTSPQGSILYPASQFALWPAVWLASSPSPTVCRLTSHCACSCSHPSGLRRGQRGRLDVSPDPPSSVWLTLWSLFSAPTVPCPHPEPGPLGWAVPQPPPESRRVCHTPPKAHWALLSIAQDLPKWGDLCRRVPQCKYWGTATVHRGRARGLVVFLLPCCLSHRPALKPTQDTAGAGLHVGCNCNVCGMGL